MMHVNAYTVLGGGAAKHDQHQPKNGSKLDLPAKATDLAKATTYRVVVVPKKPAIDTGAACMVCPPPGHVVLPSTHRHDRAFVGLTLNARVDEHPPPLLPNNITAVSREVISTRSAMAVGTGDQMPHV